MSFSEALPSTAIDTVSEFTREVLQAAVSEGLTQGPYVAAREKFEPSTGIYSTNEPPRPTTGFVDWAVFAIGKVMEDSH